MSKLHIVVASQSLLHAIKEERSIWQNFAIIEIDLITFTEDNLKQQILYYLLTRAPVYRKKNSQLQKFDRNAQQKRSLKTLEGQKTTFKKTS